MLRSDPPSLVVGRLLLLLLLLLLLFVEHLLQAGLVICTAMVYLIAAGFREELTSDLFAGLA